MAASDDDLGLSTAQNGLKIGLNFHKIVIVLLFAFVCTPAKGANFLEIVLIFVFVRGEVKNLRKTVFGVNARWKNIGDYVRKWLILKQNAENRLTKTALAGKSANFYWNGFDFYLVGGWSKKFQKLVLKLML